MRLHRRWPVLFLCATGLLLTLALGTARAVRVIFKDGFVIQGRIIQEKGWIVDKVSGKPFSVPVSGAVYVIDEDFRRTLFSPNQVQDVKPDRPATFLPIKVDLFTPPQGAFMPDIWSVDNSTPWNENWERTLTVTSPRLTRPLEMKQRVSKLNPAYICVQSPERRLLQFYHPHDLGPETLRKLLYDHFNKKRQKKLVSEDEARLNVASYLLQADWTTLAEKELGDLSMDAVQGRAGFVWKDVKRKLDLEFLEALETAFRVGRYQETRERIDQFYKGDMEKRVSEEDLLRVQEIQSKLKKARDQVELARRLLQALPQLTNAKEQKRYVQAADVILQELNPDTVARLEAFLEEGQAYESAAKAKRKKQSPENLLAFAIAGWVMGGGATVEDDPEIAWKRWAVRELVLDYQKIEELGNRHKLLIGWTSDKANPSVVARIIKYLPPPEPHATLGTKPFALQVQPQGGGKAITYHVQLPPEYHHYRLYPVLLVLHRSGEKPLDMLAKWEEQAARNGYILVAPEWEVHRQAGYYFSEEEHATVLDCLRDLRRHFQVDSDRVFLFGAEQGARMAYDVGLSHPDQFAGVLTMSATPELFARRYAANAQYLPFYMVDGEKNVYVIGNAKYDSADLNRKLFKDWIRSSYPSLYVEYRGRTADWFAGELPRMMDWMGRKKRSYPLNEVGKAVYGKPFYTLRSTDNHFYWLSTDAINKGHQADPTAWNASTPAATLHANITGGNFIVVQTNGVKQATVWIGQGMINFEQKIKIQANGKFVKEEFVRTNLAFLLEDFYQRGDRQMLFLTKISLKL